MVLKYRFPVTAACITTNNDAPLSFAYLVYNMKKKIIKL